MADISEILNYLTPGKYNGTASNLQKLVESWFNSAFQPDLYSQNFATSNGVFAAASQAKEGPKNPPQAAKPIFTGLPAKAGNPPKLTERTPNTQGESSEQPQNSSSRASNKEQGIGKLEKELAAAKAEEKSALLKLRNNLIEKYGSAEKIPANACNHDFITIERAYSEREKVLKGQITRATAKPDVVIARGDNKTKFVVAEGNNKMLLTIAQYEQYIKLQTTKKDKATLEAIRNHGLDTYSQADEKTRRKFKDINKVAIKDNDNGTPREFSQEDFQIYLSQLEKARSGAKITQEDYSRIPLETLTSNEAAQRDPRKFELDLIVKRAKANALLDD